MRLAQPRFSRRSQQPDTDQKELLAPIMARGPVLTSLKTLAKQAEAAKRFGVWAVSVLSERNDLPPRDREIVILRIGFLCSPATEWGQHVEIAKRAA